MDMGAQQLVYSQPYETQQVVYQQPVEQYVTYSQPVSSKPAAVYSQPAVYTTQAAVVAKPVAVASPPRVNTQTVVQQVQREVPKCAYDVRTVLVPKQVMEDYIVQETRMVAIQIPVTYQRSKWISIPREISIPRPMVEKRMIKKMVPKVIQVEEQYEIEVGMTEMQSFFIGADTDNSGRLSYAEWQQANAATGLSATQMRQMFDQRDLDNDGELSMEELTAAGTLPTAASASGATIVTGATVVSGGSRTVSPAVQPLSGIEPPALSEMKSA